MKDGWDYSGSRANNCTPEDRDGRVYFPPRFEEPGFGFGDLNFNPKQAKNIPKKMLRLYVAAGKRFGVDWRLLAAIGYNETRHNAIKATSPAGAQGAMQFMPPTFATYAVDGNGDGRKVITDPADSVFSAANYVRALAGLSWVGNDPVLIMASYNAGPGNTQAYGGVPPFKETRDYVINGISTMKALGWKRGQPVVFKKKGKKFVVNTGKGQTKGKRIKAHGYQGKPQKDAVSRAVAWDGERRMSPCYVAVVWDWYKAIEKYPPKMSDPTAGAPAGTRKVGGNGKFVPCPKKIPHDTANPCYVDKRIIPDLLWIHRKYKIFISDGLAGVNVPGLGRVGCGDCHSANGEHSIGLGVDIRPSPNGGSWDLIDKLAYWAEPSQGSPRKPFRWVGYNGDAGHGRGHHLHLSWDHGPGKLYYPAPWVLTMDIKQGKVTGTKTRKGAGKKKAKKRAEAKKKAKRKAKKKGKRKRRR